MRAVRIEAFGGPEVVRLREVPEPTPGPGQTLVEVDRCGVNYADTLLHENAYLAAAALPLSPGNEIVGRTADGQRVAALIEHGGYAERALITEDAAFPVPEGIADVAALALLAQGLTAWWLVERVARVRSGDSVVVHAAAGGVGSLAVQLAKRRGAHVIATAGTEAKRDLALSLGADAVVDHAVDDLTAALREANGGKAVDVVLEMIGGRVTDQSLAALAPFGRLAFYGMAGRQEPRPVAPRDLERGSITLSGFWLVHALADHAAVTDAYARLAGLVAAGELRVVAGGDYPLSEVGSAHEAIRTRTTTGKVTLDPRR